MVYDDLYSREGIVGAVPPWQAAYGIGIGNEEILVEVFRQRLGVNLAQNTETRVSTSIEQLPDIMRTVS